MRHLQLLVVVFALLAIAGCGPAGPTKEAAKAVGDAVQHQIEAPPPVAPPKDKDEADQRRADAEGKVSRLEHDLAVARADLQTAKDQADEIDKREEERHQKAMLSWFAGVLLFLAIADVVLCLAIPADAKVTGPLAVALGAAASIALVLRALYGWLTLIGGVLALGFVGYAVWLAYHRDRKASTMESVAKEAVAHGDRVVDAFRRAADYFDQEAVERLVAEEKRTSALKQIGSGVRDELDRLRGKPANRPLPGVPPVPTSIVRALPGAVAAPRPTRVPSPAEAPTEIVPTIRDAPPAPAIADQPKQEAG